jgi:hypothetical protein
MESTAQSAPVSNKRLWAGRIMSALPALFLLFDGVIHIMRIPPVVEGFAKLGYRRSALQQRSLPRLRRRAVVGRAVPA